MEGGNDIEMVDNVSINKAGNDMDKEFSPIDTQEIRDQLKKECAPMKMTNFMIQRPCAVILTGFSILILFAFLSV
jgi:hypothetical protein